MNPQDFIAEHVQNLPRSGIRIFLQLFRVPQAISLGIGEPDFITPWKIRKLPFLRLRG